MNESTGILLLPDDAAKYLRVNYVSDRQFKRDTKFDVTRHFERGDDCSTVTPFNRFSYVCVLKDAPTSSK